MQLLHAYDKKNNREIKCSKKWTQKGKGNSVVKT